IKPMDFGIEQLRQQVILDESIPMTLYIRESELIGLFDGKFAMLQNGDNIFTLNWPSLLRELFYQYYLQKFGSYQASVPPPSFQNVRTLLDSFFNVIVRAFPQKLEQFTFRNTDDCITKLMNHRETLREKILVDITEDLRLLSLPILIEGHSPSMLHAGEFLARLANYVNYQHEGECIRLMGRVLADFYSEPTVPRTFSDPDAKIEWTNLCKEVIFPQVKAIFRAPRFFYEIGGIQFKMNTITAFEGIRPFEIGRFAVNFSFNQFAARERIGFALLNCAQTESMICPCAQPPRFRNKRIMANYSQRAGSRELQIAAVELKGLVALKIIKHCQEESHANDVQGILLGMTVGRTLEVTNCYPVPRHADDEETDDSDYNFTMMKHLRNINVDQLHVGWYQCSPYGSCLSKLETVDLQYMNQNAIEESVVLMYDPIRTQRGFLSIKAYRLTSLAMSLCKEGEFTTETLQRHNMSFDKFFEEIPVVIKNSLLTNSLICEMQKEMEPDEGKQFLDMGTISVLEKSVHSLMKCVEEAMRWAYYQRQFLIKQQQVSRENAMRQARGEPPLSEEEVNKMVKTTAPLQRLEASLNYTQTLNFCEQSSSFAAENIAKLFTAKALQPSPAEHSDHDGLLGDESNPSVHDEEGEDLFGDDMELDYVPRPELDVYEEEHLDDHSVSELSIGERIAVEAELRERDRAEGRRGRLRRGLEYLEETSENYREIKRRRRLAENALRGIEEDEGLTETIDNLEDTRGMSNKEWVSQIATRNEIKNRFKHLLKTYVDANGHSVFREKLRAMTEQNQQSFELEYDILAREQQALALFLPEVPHQMLELFNSASKEVVLSIYPNYTKIAPEIFVRIKDLAITDEIRSLRQLHLSQLIRTEGVVTSSTSIIPQLSLIKFDCLKCKYVLGPFIQTQEEEVKPGTCPGCQSLGPFAINMEETIFKNYQRLTTQESPGRISAGRVPRAKDVIVLGDLCDSCRPGDEIDLTGIYSNTYDGSLNIANGFPVFSTVIMANNIIRKEDWTSVSQTMVDEDISRIVNLSKDPNIFERIMASICPSVYGHKPVKRAIALALFGGVAKTQEKHRVRGDINVLLCGDPGTAKSQFLKYTSKIAPRAVYTTGQGASAVGLTAYVQKSPVTREWTLEAGALVLADNGVCLIDEFDKMSDRDRTSIHEAMEQQTISVSKAGIVASLKARCSVIAAANPIGGRYNGRNTFSQNVELTEPIISRFDIICVVRDEINEFDDQLLTKFVVRSHIKSHPDVTDEELSAVEQADNDDRIEEFEPIRQDLLRKYIVYARDKIKPVLSTQQQDQIAKVYADMRRESAMTNSIPITARHIESIIRCSEAYARMHLRNYVNNDDVRMAIKVTLESFVSTQRAMVRKNMESMFAQHLNYNRSSTELLLTLLKNMVLEEQQILKQKFGPDTPIDEVEIDERDFRQRCRRVDASDPSYFYRVAAFANHNFTYDPDKKVIRYTRVLS
ncbi:DNA replication licensing factor mcm2, partial [Fragariocoptes setiger]